MRRSLRVGLALIGSAMAVAVPVALAGGAAVDAAPDEGGNLWFVQLSGSADAFRTKAKAAGLEFTQRFEYKRVWNGLSIQTDPANVPALKRLGGVEAVYPVLRAALEPTEIVTPDLAYALAMSGASNAQQAGYTGEGIKVAVMDTGVDYDHPDLGGNGNAAGNNGTIVEPGGNFPNSRVAAGWDFVGDRFNASGSGGELVPHPDPDPDDCGGHGTHVAGIIGADGDPEQGGALGVAPGVTFGSYRVFGCEGSTTADVMLAAMERAAADDMDLLNMSIGSAFMTWPQYPTAQGADRLVNDHGMIVIASIGNSGANGVYSAGAPGVGRDVIGVASFDNSHVELKTFKLSGDNRSVGYMQATAAADAPTSGTATLARTGTPTSGSDACDPLPAGSLAGKVALIRRGTCTFHVKTVNAQNAGAAGVVLYNNVPGLFSATVAGTTPITIPVVSISDTDGVEVNNRIAAGEASGTPVEMTWTDETGTFPNPTGGRASSFTSYGLTAELDLKPDIGAPGGLIKSTYPLESGGYATLSGTSMSSPHVAGTVALLLEARGPMSPALVRTVLQNSADPVPSTAGTAFREPVHRAGAGMVDIDDSIAATTLVQPGKLALGEGTAAHTRTLTITNNGSSAVSYTLSHTPALGTRGSTFAPILTTNSASVTFAPSSVTVPAGGSATVNATITPNTSSALFTRSVYGGYLVVTGGGKTLRVPYAGFTGDYQTIQALAEGGCSFPGVFKRGGQTECVPAAGTTPAVMLSGFTRQAAGATFNVEDWNDRPVLLYHLAHQSRRLTIEAIDSAGGAHAVAQGEYLRRNQTNDRASTGYFTYTWDGKELFVDSAGKPHRRELPAGQYSLRITVLKALGDPANAAHSEVWTSPTFTIERVE